MRGLRKGFIAWGLLIYLVVGLGITPLTVQATGNDSSRTLGATLEKKNVTISGTKKPSQPGGGSTDTGGGEDNPDKNELEELARLAGGTETQQSINLCYYMFVSMGYSPQAAAGVCGNIVGESGGQPYRLQSGGGGGIGLYQFSGGNRDSLVAYTQECIDANAADPNFKENHTGTVVTNTGKSYLIGDELIQTAFVISAIEKTWSTYAKRLDKYNSFVSGEKKVSGASSNVFATYKDPVFYPYATPVEDLATFKNITNCYTAALAFVVAYERPGAINAVVTEDANPMASTVVPFYATYKKRGDAAQEVYDRCSGGSASINSADALYAAGLLENDGATAEEISIFGTMTGLNVDGLLQGATRDGLTSAEQTSLKVWEDATQSNSPNNRFISLFRQVLMGIAILGLVWSLLFFAGYFVDRLNPFFDLDVIGILTIKRLRVVQEEDEATYRLGKNTKAEGASGPQTIGLSGVIEVSLITSLVSISIISGLFFKLVSMLIIKIWEMLGKI